MTKDKKSVPFSTRWTGSMDMRLEELREVMMLTKQDIVRMAMSEFLVKHRDLIDSSIEYKDNSENIKYKYFELIQSKSSNVVDSGWWIIGGDFYNEDGILMPHIDLAKIEVNFPKSHAMSSLPGMLNKLKTTDPNDTQLISIKSQIDEMVATQIYEEYTVKFTKYGLEIKEDPKFKIIIDNSVKEITDELKEKNN